MQKRFHHAFLQATAMHLFRDDVDVDLARVMKQNQWESLKQQCLCMTPRRFGKTMSVGMFVAAYLYAVENAEICIFSTGRRASQKLLELIKSLIEKLPNGRDRIQKFNQEILNLSNYDGSPGAAKLSSFPSNAKTLRGVGGNLVIMEEVSIPPHISLYNVLGGGPTTRICFFLISLLGCTCAVYAVGCCRFWESGLMYMLLDAVTSENRLSSSG